MREKSASVFQGRRQAFSSGSRWGSPHVWDIAPLPWLGCLSFAVPGGEGLIPQNSSSLALPSKAGHPSPRSIKCRGFWTLVTLLFLLGTKFNSQLQTVGFPRPRWQVPPPNPQGMESGFDQQWGPLPQP